MLQAPLKVPILRRCQALKRCVIRCLCQGIWQGIACQVECPQLSVVLTHSSNLHILLPICREASKANQANQHCSAIGACAHAQNYTRAGWCCVSLDDAFSLRGKLRVTVCNAALSLSYLAACQL